MPTRRKAARERKRLNKLKRAIRLHEESPRKALRHAKARMWEAWARFARAVIARAPDELVTIVRGEFNRHQDAEAPCSKDYNLN